jgi:hypothetical protein
VKITSEGRTPQQAAPGISHLPPQPLERRSCPHVPQLLFGQRDAPEFPVRRELCLAQRGPCLEVLLRREFKVDLKLAIEVVILSFAPAPEAAIFHESPCSAGSSL